MHTSIYLYTFDSLYSTCYIYIVLDIGVTMYYFLLPFQTRELEPFFGCNEMQGSAPPTFDDGIDWVPSLRGDLCGGIQAIMIGRMPPTHEISGE